MHRLCFTLCDLPFFMLLTWPVARGPATSIVYQPIEQATQHSGCIQLLSEHLLVHDDHVSLLSFFAASHMLSIGHRRV